MKKIEQTEPPLEEDQLKEISAVRQNRGDEPIELNDSHRMELINLIVDTRGKLAETTDPKQITVFKHEISVLEHKLDLLEHSPFKKAA